MQKFTSVGLLELQGECYKKAHYPEADLMLQPLLERKRLAFVKESVLNDIFDSDSFVYKSIVEITLKDKTKIKEEIIAMKDTYLLTLSNKRININDIINIKKAN